MDQQIKLYRVFIASPGDLADERKALRDVVERINGICARETDWRIELLGWEDTLPGAGRPQELINADLEKADLFIGCLWQRWGTPTGDGNKTGFEEEFCRSLEKYKLNGTPEIWLFLKKLNLFAVATRVNSFRRFWRSVLHRSKRNNSFSENLRNLGIGAN